MTPETLTRAARQIALPAIGADGQERIGAATVAVVGDDLTCEVVARALAAAGVGALRLVRRTGAPSAAVMAAFADSNPEARVTTRAWPVGDTPAATGAGWVDALGGCAVVARSGFDDDPMLRAAIRAGVPAVVARGRAEAVDVISFRRQGPCVHAPLDLPTAGAAAPTEDGAAAVIAAQVVAAEVLVLLAGADAGAGRARHLRLPLDGGGAPRTIDIPWSPECFACGGSGTEMSFS